MEKTQKTVYLGMIGDIMHPGLINIINEGAKYGNVMIGLFTDKAIATHKRLPYLTYEQRKNVIENIRGVASIVPQDEWSYVPNLLKYKPDYIIHGDDWQYGPDKYIRDAIEIFEEYGWDWCYHAYREWPAWSVEYTHAGDYEIGKWVKATADTDRKKELLKGLSRNRRKGMRKK